MLLRSKAEHINSHILHLTYTLVGTVNSEHESACISNPVAFQDLLAGVCNLTVCLSVNQSFSVSQSVWLSVCLSVFLCQSVSQSGCLSVCLSVCLSLHVFLFDGFMIKFSLSFPFLCKTAVLTSEKLSDLYFCLSAVFNVCLPVYICQSVFVCMSSVFPF